MTDRDPFADDVLERLARSNMDYQRTHGNYIVPLAERLLDARARLADLAETAQVVVTEHEQENPFVGYSIDALKAALAALQEGKP